MVFELTQHFVLGYFRSSAWADSFLFRLFSWADFFLFRLFAAVGSFLSAVRCGGGSFRSLDIDGMWPWTAR